MEECSRSVSVSVSDSDSVSGCGTVGRPLHCNIVRLTDSPTRLQWALRHVATGQGANGAEASSLGEAPLWLNGDSVPGVYFKRRRRKMRVAWMESVCCRAGPLFRFFTFLLFVFILFCPELCSGRLFLILIARRLLPSLMHSQVRRIAWKMREKNTKIGSILKFNRRGWKGKLKYIR